MIKTRVALILNWFILVSLILTSCGFPWQATPTPTIPTPIILGQTAPPAIIETDPPLESVIGHLSPLTFYFNQAMNQSTVEPAFSGLPAGSYIWKDESTLFYTPAESYPPNSKLKISISTAIQSATGFGITEPIELAFTVADFLRATNILPKADSTDANVDAAIVASFNQPVVALGDTSNQPSALSIQPSVSGSGEWINTSTYIFYPESSMAGGTEYTVSLNPALKTVTGVPLDGSEQNAWKFVTARPRVITLSPSAESFVALDTEIKLTFNQPMNEESVQANFLLSGTEGPVSGTFAWNEDDTELTFTPNDLLARNVGFLLNLNETAQSRGGVALGEDFGAVLNSYPDFAVTATDAGLDVTTFTFSAPLAEADYEDLVTISPTLDNFEVQVLDFGDQRNMLVRGDFIPDTNYFIELSASIRDQWGGALGRPYVLDFRTPSLSPSLNIASRTTAVFVRPDNPALLANAVNIQQVDVTVAPVSLQEFIPLLSAYDAQQTYTPTNPSVYVQTLELTPNQNQTVALNLTQDNNQLPTGLYYVAVSQPLSAGGSKNVYFAVSSQVNLTVKRGATEALVWAVDLPTQTAVANAPIALYDHLGNPIGSGTTDAKGLWKGEITPNNGTIYAVLGSPGDENFSLATSHWTADNTPYTSGYARNFEPPHTTVYLYTDRPIYRPGQTVYFRGVARQAFNGRYELPPLNEVVLDVMGWDGVKLSTINANLSPYGTFNGEIQLPEDAAPGYYSMQNESLNFYFGFQVAEYRKPEINLSVDFPKDEIKRGESISAVVNAQYFFGAPAGDAEVRWVMYTRPDYFYLPGFQTGLLDDSWLDVYGSGFGASPLGEGTGQTTPEGTLSIELPAVPALEAGQVVTLEVTVFDESGFPVSARTELLVHPSNFYIGLKADSWIGTSKEAIGFDVFTTDWTGIVLGDKTLFAEFKQVRWEKETGEFGLPIYTPVYTPVSSSNLATGPDGKARLSFVPPNSGTFMLDVSGGGPSTGSVRSQILVWVGGIGTAAWPELESNRIQLTAGKESYDPGETASVFIPNPFATNSLALVTVERGIVFKSEVITLIGSGEEYSLPVTQADAPNVYVTATVLGVGNEFKHGVLNIPVAADALELNVQVEPNPEQVGPREDVTLDVVVTDNVGQPVEGEFSLSVVDLAVLALAEPNAADIFTEFYSEQPLGIETSISLAAYGDTKPIEVPGKGGGGGGEPSFLREEFPDTAYWNPSLITNSEGRGQVTMTLPDSLTTWHIDVRGLTVDTKVGQAETEIISTKPLLVRPVTPRFLVSGDHVQMAAVINNNTADALSVNVSLQSEGFALDEPDKATQQVNVPANGQTRVEWWGTASLAESADLIFTALANGNSSLQDSTRPVWGTLPILQYTSPQAFVTGGSLRGAVTQQEVISLPRTFTPTSGGLEVELSPSLAGSLTSALEALPEPNENSAEAIVSYILPNVEVYRALSNAGLNEPKLADRVTANLNSSVSRLFYLQNSDGGWIWWGSIPASLGTEGSESDPYISAYVFLGLLRAREAGATINEEALQRAGVYLRDLKPTITINTDSNMLDEITFMQFALAHANTFDENLINQLYDARDRLSPSGKALLAFTLNTFNSADTRSRDLISNLESSAILSSSSAHWESPDENFFDQRSTIYTTSIIVYTLANIDPANQLLPNAIRYLTAHRNANKLWNIGHDNAWAILALNAAMVGLGEVRADFAFNAAFNGSPLTGGDIAGIQVTPITATVPLEFLSPNSPNLLTIHREDGLGRLYYNATLQLNRPVEDVKPLDQGMQIQRTYVDFSCDENCPPLSSLRLDPLRLQSTQGGANKLITAQLTLTLPHDAYYVMVEDFIPAGTEILDQNLNTTQQGIDATEVQVQFDDKNPFAKGWGWWLFNPPQIHNESILFTANFLPAGTYVLTYTLTPLQAGEYRVLPAHAWQAFFPEVQGTSAGMVFEIEP